MSKKRNKDLKRAEKRKLELERKRQKTKNMMIMSVVLIAVISVVVFVGVSMSGNNNVVNDRDTEPAPDQTEVEVRIPISEVGDEVKFYEYDTGKKMIKYFAVLSPDGGVRVAFDACDLCWDQYKGYRQSGDVMQCINCGKQYSITDLGPKMVSGCWPTYLPWEIVGDEVVIKKTDIESLADHF